MRYIYSFNGRTYNFAVIAVHCYDESNLFLTENGCLSCAMCLKNKFKKPPTAAYLYPNSLLCILHQSSL